MSKRKNILNIAAYVAGLTGLCLTVYENYITKNKFGKEIKDFQENFKNVKESFIIGDIFEYINKFTMVDFIEYLHSISSLKKLALINIFGISAIFFSFNVVLLNFIWEFSIKKFDLENKFPFLKKLFSLRRNFNTYYRIYSYVTSFIVLIVLMFVNVGEFTGGW